MPRIRLPVRVEPAPPRTKGRGGGRRKGIPNRTTRSSREAIIQALNECDPKDGMVGVIKKLIRKNLDNVIPLLQLVTPKQADVMFRNEAPVLTVEDLDRSLIAAGLPVTRQVFGLDFRGEPVEDATEAELVAEDNGNK